MIPPPNRVEKFKEWTIEITYLAVQQADCMCGESNQPPCIEPAYSATAVKVAWVKEGHIVIHCERHFKEYLERMKQYYER